MRLPVAAAAARRVIASLRVNVGPLNRITTLTLVNFHMCLSHTVEHSNHRPMRIRDDRPSHVRFGSNSTELAEATRPFMSAVPR
jgi:hypothetical protein